MRRTAVWVTATFSLALVALIGCKSSGKQEEMPFGSDLTAEDPYLPPAEQQPYARSDAYPVYGSPDPAAGASEIDSAARASGTQYHTVARHDTLYGLARTYYGDQRRWKDIYEANRATISDPNKIRVGQRLLIP